MDSQTHVCRTPKQYLSGGKLDLGDSKQGRVKMCKDLVLI